MGLQVKSFHDLSWVSLFGAISSVSPASPPHLDTEPRFELCVRFSRHLMCNRVVSLALDPSSIGYLNLVRAVVTSARWSELHFIVEVINKGSAGS